MNKIRIKKFLLHPMVLLFAISVGVFMGLYYRELALTLGKYGEIYLAMLQMCVLPIMIGAVVSSLGRMLKSSSGSVMFVGKIFFVFIMSMSTIAVFVLVVSIIIKPGGNLDKKTRVILSQEIAKSELESGDNHESQGKVEFQQYLKDIVPTNIFRSVSEGRSLQVLFFSIILGFSLGLLRSDNSDVAIALADAVYEALLKVVGWIILGLPLGLCFLIGGQISRLGIDVFIAMIDVVVIIYIISIGIMFIYSIIIWKRSGGGYIDSLKALKEPLLVAFGTSSSYAAIPSALKSMSSELPFDKSTTNLTIPMGTSFNPQGNVIHFVIVAVFVSQIYGISFTPTEYFILVVSSILAAVAAAGAPGILALAMLQLVLEPLGLPVAVGIILFTAIDPIIDPILTTVNVHANCAATSILGNKTADGPPG